MLSACSRSGDTVRRAERRRDSRAARTVRAAIIVPDGRKPSRGCSTRECARPRVARARRLKAAKASELGHAAGSNAAIVTADSASRLGARSLALPTTARLPPRYRCAAASSYVRWSAPPRRTCRCDGARLARSSSRRRTRSSRTATAALVAVASTPEPRRRASGRDRRTFRDRKQLCERDAGGTVSARRLEPRRRPRRRSACRRAT